MKYSNIWKFHECFCDAIVSWYMHHFQPGICPLINIFLCNSAWKCWSVISCHSSCSFHTHHHSLFACKILLNSKHSWLVTHINSTVFFFTLCAEIISDATVREKTLPVKCCPPPASFLPPSSSLSDSRFQSTIISASNTPEGKQTFKKFLLTHQA